MQLARYGRLAAALLLLPLSACTSRQVVPRGDTSLAPPMVIERFLRAVNSNDLDTMSQLFGNMDGPIADRESRQMVDDRMFVIASALRHSDYRIEGEQIVPGRRDEATQFVVALTINNQRYTLPFTLVQSRRSGWLIENIPIERVLQRPGR